MAEATKATNARIEKLRGEKPARMQRWLAALVGDPTTLE
jgi:hypothetical protein